MLLGDGNKLHFVGSILQQFAFSSLGFDSSKLHQQADVADWGLFQVGITKSCLWWNTLRKIFQQSLGSEVREIVEDLVHFEGILQACFCGANIGLGKKGVENDFQLNTPQIHKFSEMSKKVRGKQIGFAHAKGWKNSFIVNSLQMVQVSYPFKIGEVSSNVIVVTLQKAHFHPTIQALYGLHQNKCRTTLYYSVVVAICERQTNTLLSPNLCHSPFILLQGIYSLLVLPLHNIYFSPCSGKEI